MKIKPLILFSMIFIMSNSVSAFSPKIESFEIRNYSNRNIVISREFWEDVSGAENNYMWTQTINGLNLMIKDFMAIVNRNIVPPNGNLTIIEYFPSVSPSQSAAMYTRMNNTPLMVKMESIFKSLTISEEDGNTVITIDTLGDQIIKKMELSGETAYILEIFDYDLEGKPGSEW